MNEREVASSFITHHSAFIIFLVRERLAGPDDAYAVVCEFEVRAGQLDLGHVAGGASLLSYGAGLGVALVGCLLLRHARRLEALLRAVAGEALRVVEGPVL